MMLTNHFPLALTIRMCGATPPFFKFFTTRPSIKDRDNFFICIKYRQSQFIKKNQQDATMYQNFIIPYLYEAQYVSGDTPPIIRSLKLHWQPLVLHTWEVVGRVVGGRCQAHTMPDNVHQLHVQQPSRYAKPEATSAVLGS